MNDPNMNHPERVYDILGDAVQADVSTSGKHVTLATWGLRGALHDALVLEPDAAWTLIRQLTNAAYEAERAAAPQEVAA